MQTTLERRIGATQFSARDRAMMRTRSFTAADAVSQPQDTRVLEGRFARPESGETAASRVRSYITHFDQNWREEGLPQDWYMLKKDGLQVGFSMRSQMAMLEDPTDQEQVEAWTKKTKMNLMGFKLEYLSDHVVYPCKYSINKENPRRLECPLYGNKDMVDTVSPAERNGSVRNALKEMKAYFLSDKTPDGAISIMTSPKGKTGLQTDDEKPIDYPDSYFFIMQKQGDSVMNYTLKTDFNLEQCRRAVTLLTGRVLPPEAKIEDYVGAIAKITPGEFGIESVVDVIRLLERIQPDHAFVNEGDQEKIPWADVYTDIAQGEKLYEYNKKNMEILDDFEAFGLEGGHTALELQKGIAATILRQSQVFFTEEKAPKTKIVMHQDVWETIDRERMNYGAILRNATEQVGCGGGGKKKDGTSVVAGISITPRLGVTQSNEDEYGSLTFDCPHCGYTNTRPQGELVEYCQSRNCGESVRC